jgi:hypothetical protein
MPNPSIPSLSGQKKGSKAEERRVARRERRHIELVWRLLTDGEDRLAPGHVHDISRSGLSIVLPVAVRPGSILLIKLEQIGTFFTEASLIRVRHVTAKADGTWFAGCSFVSKFGEAEFQMLLQMSRDRGSGEEPRPAATSSQREERRQVKRHASKRQPDIRIRAVNLVRSEALGKVRDYSEGGLSLLSEEAYPIGTLLVVRLEKPGEASWGNQTMQVRVVHCRKSSAGWIVGCKFVDSPSASQMKQLD